MKKEQLNVRVDASVRRASRVVAASLGWTMEQVVEASLAGVLGASDNATKKRVQQLHKAAVDLNLHCGHGSFC